MQLLKNISYEHGVYRRFPRRFKKGLLPKYAACRIDLARTISKLESAKWDLLAMKKHHDEQIDALSKSADDLGKSPQKSG